MQENLAFVFPGQGSQKIGMLSTLAEEYPIVTETFSEASDILGYDLWARVQKGTAEEINLTECTQPLLLAASVAIWRVWKFRGGITPAFLAGHSLGEWSALVCAEVITFADGIKLVQQRGKFMQEAVPAGVGAMAAIIGLSDELIQAACKSASEKLNEEVGAVNFNSPGQVVIAGHTAAVECAMALCKEAGAKRTLPLPVSAPFHTSLMRPAASRLAEQVMQTPFMTPKIPVVHNVHAKIESNPEDIKNIIIEQIYTPVQWVDCVNTLAENGVNQIVECGPGKVLSGLIKRINKSIATTPIETPDSMNALLNE